jgi:hypothetical protein
MPKRVNYGFEKRQRELEKQKKKEEKAQRRKLEKEASQPQKRSEDAPDTRPPGSGRLDRH